MGRVELDFQLVGTSRAWSDHHGRGCYISSVECDACLRWSEGTALPLFNEMLPSVVVWDKRTEHIVNSGGGLLDLLAHGAEPIVDKETKLVVDPDIHDELPLLIALSLL